MEDGGKAMEKVSVGAGLRERARMEKGVLIPLVKKVLKSDTDLNFLRKLETEELETLVACIRMRLDLEKKYLIVRAH